MDIFICDVYFFKWYCKIFSDVVRNIEVYLWIVFGIVWFINVLRGCIKEFIMLVVGNMCL